MKFWFSADLHLHHANIINLCDRPFKDIEDMDNKLIVNWNSRVRSEDTIFHLGDFCYKNDGRSFKEYYKRLNGTKIFIKGNHDGNNGVRTPILDITIHHGGNTLLLLHNPSDISYTTSILVLCGHVHNAWKYHREYYSFGEHDSGYTDFCNVGVDMWGYHPISINEIFNGYEKWKLGQI